VPVNLRDRGISGQLGNALSHLRVPLPLRTGDPVQRIGKITLATGDKRTVQYATAWDAVIAVLGRLPPLLVTLISSRLVFQSPRYASTICTAVPLLSRDLALAGRPVLSGAGGPALMGCHGLVFAFANDRGQHRICVTADGVNRRFAEAVQRGLRRELHELAALAPLATVRSRP
jgi:diacylglycerol O-acyltransferase / wax synthase